VAVVPVVAGERVPEVVDGERSSPPPQAASDTAAAASREARMRAGGAIGAAQVTPRGPPRSA